MRCRHLALPRTSMDTVSVTRPAPAFTDERGSITDLINSVDPVHHIGHITFTTGAVRANHYHKESNQYDYVLEGKIELATRAVEEGAEVSTVILEPGDLAYVPKNTIHAYRALEDSVVINVTTTSREGAGYEEDTVRVDSLFE
jgi:quercetin dioxygenase-like cupin family protein